MLFVTNNGQTEAILESNYEKYEEQNGAALQISFDSFDFPENVGHKLLDYNVIIEDEDGHQYKVRDFTESLGLKKIIATHIYYDLVGHRKYNSFTGTNNFSNFATWLFNGTGWNFINVDVNDTLVFNSFGNDNFLQLIQRLIDKFRCEMEILPNKFIRFSKIIGEKNDLQYRYKSNIKELTRTIDTTNVRTRITAYGANGISTTYTSPLVSNPNFGLLDAEPVTDESIDNISELMDFAKASLNDVPQTNLNVSVLSLDGNVGDFVWIIHEEMGLEYQARILSKRTRRDYNESEVEIGNTPKRTIEDILITQKEEVKVNKEEAEKAVADLEEKTTAQTEEIRLYVSNSEQTLYSQIELTATQIRSEVNNVESRINSTITQTANQINLRVNDNDLRISEIDIRADQIQSNVTNLENSTSSSITQLSNNINLKVDVGGTISDINLSQGTATINAEKINLNGAVIVNGSISGATDINVNRNVAVGNALYFGGSQGSIDFIQISGSGMTLNSTSINVVAPGGFFVNGVPIT